MEKEFYSSPEQKISFFAKRYPGHIFYSKMFCTVLKAYGMIKTGAYTKEAWMNGSLDTLKALESVGIRFEVENLSSFQNLDSPCVFACNHMSTLETFVLPCFIQRHRDVTFVVKESLAKYPVFKHIVLNRNNIIVGRVNPRKDFITVLNEGKKRLEENISVIIFPQTTRSNQLVLKNFNTIGIKLARHAGVPIIPVALKTDAWGVGKIIKDFGKIDPTQTVHFSFGDPIYIDGKGKEEHNAVYEFIHDKLNAWRI